MKRTVIDIFRKIHRRKIGTRLTSMLLTLFLLFYVVPTVIYAEVADAFSSYIDEKDSGEHLGETAVNDIEIYEAEELREESAKHFRLPDGSYVAAQYAYPVHTMDENGVWQDIDNTLALGTNGMYGTSDSRIKFAKKITGNETLFTLKDKNTKVLMSLAGASKGIVGTVTNGDDAEEATELQKLMHLEKLCYNE